MDKFNLLNGRDIICISTSDWLDHWGSKQQLMVRLAKDNRIFYVEYQASIFHLAFSAMRNRIRKLFGTLNKKGDNIFVYTPPVMFLPFGYYFRFINKINQMLLAIILKRYVRKLNLKNTILWIYPPSAVDLLNRFKYKAAIYHCIADFPFEKTSWLRSHTIIGMEEELAVRSALLLAMTKKLYVRLSKFNQKIVLIPSAVDFDFFNSSAVRNPVLPDDIENIKKPIIGLIGYLDGSVIDTELLEYIASERPGWSIVLVGPMFRKASSFRNLMLKNNVYFLRGKLHAEIPRYINAFDVCLIPYRINCFIKNVSPVKLYEYLSLGKPIVSTDFLNGEDCVGLIYVSNSREDFVSCIEKSLNEENINISQRRIEMARNNTWDSRLQLIRESLVS